MEDPPSLATLSVAAAPGQSEGMTTSNCVSEDNDNRGYTSKPLQPTHPASSELLPAFQPRNASSSQPSVPEPAPEASSQKPLLNVHIRCTSLQDRLQDFQEWLDVYLPPNASGDATESPGSMEIKATRPPTKPELSTYPLRHVSDSQCLHTGNIQSSFIAQHHNINRSPGAVRDHSSKDSQKASRHQQSTQSSHLPRRHTLDDVETTSRSSIPILSVKHLRRKLNGIQQISSPLSPRSLHPPVRPIRSDVQDIFNSDCSPPLPPRRVGGQDMQVCQLEIRTIPRDDVETPPPAAAYANPYFVPHQPSRTSFQCQSRRVRSDSSAVSTLSSPPIPLKSRRRASGRPLIYWTIFGQAIDPPLPWVPGGWI
ncbi:uncharacterized protein BROUX77_004414 [Berkeleyomyces rouxiae]|uniref:uncharacterized protein n=1 Tax=Berkeleyomyces rouxiae TaxID=2035830 RepID=UPI003B7F0D95